MLSFNSNLPNRCLTKIYSKSHVVAASSHISFIFLFASSSKDSISRYSNLSSSRSLTLPTKKTTAPAFLSSTLELPSPNLDQNRFFEPLQLSCNSWAYPPVIGGKKAISVAPSIEALKSVTIF